MLNRIKTCNDLHYGIVLFDTETDGKVIDVDKLFAKRHEIIDNCKKGIYQEPCASCDKFVEDEWDDDTNIKYLSLFHWLQCNCACVYCFQAKERELEGGFTDEIKKSQYYDAYPVLKEMQDKNLLQKGRLYVEFGGGEPAILKELPDLIKIVNETGFEFSVIMSSGILYSKDIQSLLENPNTSISVTIAAGSRDVYKKIKQRDKFEQVKENLRTYIANAPYPENIRVRYLIYEGINDNEKDIKDWLDMCEEIGTKSVEITFEFCQSFNEKSGQPYSPHLDTLIDFYKKYTDERGIFNAFVDNTTKGIIERGHY